MYTVFKTNCPPIAPLLSALSDKMFLSAIAVQYNIDNE